MALMGDSKNQGQSSSNGGSPAQALRDLMALKQQRDAELAKLAQTVKQAPPGINPDGDGDGLGAAVIPFIQPFMAQAFAEAQPDGKPDFSDFPTTAVPDLVRRWMREDPAREPREQAYLQSVKALITRYDAQGLHAFEQDMTDPALGSRIDAGAIFVPATAQLNQQFDDDLEALQTRFLQDLGGGVPTVLEFSSGFVATERGDFDEDAPLYDTAPGVVITPELEPDLQNIALDYFLSTGKRLYVTSGYRDAHEQAQTAYDHIIGRGAPNGSTDPTLSIYRDRGQAAAIVNAYNDPANAGEAAKVDAMADVIQSYFDKGHPFSKHLNSRAFDTRKAGVDDTFVKQAATGNQYTASTDEPGAAPHYHVQAN